MADVQVKQSTAVVTGATSGIGRVIALHLVRQGLKVAGIGRDRAALAALEAEAAELSGDFVAVSADVTVAAQLRNGFDHAEDRCGPVGLVIACAGVAGSWWHAVTTDLFGTFLTMQEGARRMVPRRRGRLITMYGNLGDRGGPNLSAFASAKAAVARLSECLATELKDAGVHVYCVHPGFVRTPMTEELAWGDAGQRYLPGFGERAEKHWGDGRDTLVLIDEIREGRADALTGRLLFVDDDLAVLGEQAGSSPDLRRLRISLEVGPTPGSA